jgi:hypothetical protein
VSPLPQATWKVNPRSALPQPPLPSSTSPLPEKPPPANRLPPSTPVSSCGLGVLCWPGGGSRDSTRWRQALDKLAGLVQASGLPATTVVFLLQARRRQQQPGPLRPDGGGSLASLAWSVEVVVWPYGRRRRPAAGLAKAGRHGGLPAPTKAGCRRRRSAPLSVPLGRLGGADLPPPPWAAVVRQGMLDLVLVWVDLAFLALSRP